MSLLHQRLGLCSHARPASMEIRSPSPGIRELIFAHGLKLPSLILAFGLAAGASLFAADPPAPAPTPTSPADSDYAAIMAIKSQEVFANTESLKNSEKLTKVAAHSAALCDAALKFYETYPADPRRWDMVLILKNTARQFIKEIGPGFDAHPPVFAAVVMDKDAQAAWNKKVGDLFAAMRVATNLNAKQREAMDTADFYEAVAATLLKGDKMGPQAGPGTFAVIKAFATKYPDSEAPFMETTARGLMYSYETTHSAAESEDAWKTFVGTPNKQLADIAKAKVATLDILSNPIELTFSALDGRTVDLKNLRGKVVLLDFWATWCGPCMAELPNVKKVYQAYHDKGLEIVGISCDVAPDQAKTPAWVNEAKTGHEVLDFTKIHDMPWPEYYEGKKHNEGGNSIAARFSVTGIPCSFLIDKTGHVVAMNLRGEALEAGVKKQLEIQDQAAPPAVGSKTGG